MPTFAVALGLAAALVSADAPARDGLIIRVQATQVQATQTPAAQPVAAPAEAAMPVMQQPLPGQQPPPNVVYQGPPGQALNDPAIEARINAQIQTLLAPPSGGFTVQRYARPDTGNAGYQASPNPPPQAPGTSNARNGSGNGSGGGGAPGGGGSSGSAGNSGSTQQAGYPSGGSGFPQGGGGVPQGGGQQFGGNPGQGAYPSQANHQGQGGGFPGQGGFGGQGGYPGQGGGFPSQGGYPNQAGFQGGGFPGQGGFGGQGGYGGQGGFGGQGGYGGQGGFGSQGGGFGQNGYGPPPVKRYAVARAGDTVYATLDQGYNSDDPQAPIFATIYDIDSTQAPGPLQGVRLIGQIVYSTNQAAIQFTQMVLNDGRQFPLKAFAISARDARTGISDDVDEHIFERYAGLFAAALIQGAGQAGQLLLQTNRSAIIDPMTGFAISQPGSGVRTQAALAALMPLGQAATAVAAQNFNKPATIAGMPGYGIGVVFLEPPALPRDAIFVSTGGAIYRNNRVVSRLN